MRALFAIACLLSLLAVQVGCTDPSLTGTCVGDTDFTDDPQIVPDQNPFRFCPIDPNAKYTDGTPANMKKGALVLHNCGRLTLKITDATLTNAGIEVFKNLQIEEKEIGAGKEVAMQFLYESKDLLAHEGTITITSNAKNFPTFEIGLYVSANGSIDASICPLIVPATDAGTVDH